MKTRIFLVTILLALCGAVRTNAQEASPVIKELRALVESGKTNFKNEIGPFIKTDEASKISLYKTKKETTAATTLIMQSQDKQCVYMIRYDMKDMNADMVGLMAVIVDQYINELNAMVKTGNYTGKDATDSDGLDVTQLYDLAGNHVLDYKSTKEIQSIYLYGLNYQTKK